MIITLAQPGDLPALQALLQSAFVDYVQGLGRARPDPHPGLSERIDAGEAHVARDGAAVLGLILLSHDPETAALTIDILAVDPDAQGRGVGRALLAHAETLERGKACRTLKLHTVAKYDHLVGLYRSVGFEVTHLGPRPRGDDGHDRAFMAKSLTEANAEP